jgi:hypothetical protein
VPKLAVVQKGWEPVKKAEATEAGYEWRCNGCAFRSVHLSHAIAHVSDPEVSGSFAHICWEVSSVETDPPARVGTRRLYAQDDGIQCDRKVRRAAAA